MKKSEMEELEKLIGQIDGVHREISALTKKSSTDAINLFKLKFINSILLHANKFLGNRYKPFPDFDTFAEDAIPSNSDVTFILAQYAEAAERYRGDNIYMEFKKWMYRISDTKEVFHTSEPKSFKKGKP